MNVAIDFISIIILVLMLVNFGSRYAHRRLETSGRLFTAMLLVNLLLLLTDMFSWIFNGPVSEGARLGNILSNTFHYMLQPIMCLLWLMYCDNKLTGSQPRRNWRTVICALPAMTAEVLVAINLFHPILFSVDANNIYRRENLYHLYAAINLLYVLHTFIFTLRIIHARSAQRWRSRTSLHYLLIYPLFPLTGFIIQTLSYGIAVVWSGSVISLLIIYFNLQNAQITTDQLTGLSNRHRFESYIAHRLRNRQAAQRLFLLMIDVDRFKSINDAHGHLAGDEALKAVARLITRAVRRSDFVARIGGDEFVVVGERTDSAAIAAIKADIHREFEAFNQSSSLPFALSVSIGCGEVAASEEKAVEVLLAEADSRMYEEKQRQHALQKEQGSAGLRSAENK